MTFCVVCKEKEADAQQSAKNVVTNLTNTRAGDKSTFIRLHQGSQTHLSMWAAVEDNSQSAGRTTKCNVIRNTVLTAVES